MTKKLTRMELEDFADDFDVTEAEIQRVYKWMQENVGDYEDMTKLAEAAMAAFPDVGDEDEDLFFELAFKFESVVG